MTNGDQPTNNVTTTTPDPLEELKRQADIAELEAKIKQAELDQTKAQLETQLAIAKAQVEQEFSAATTRAEILQTLIPKGETKPLEGTIQTDAKFGQAAELVAYQVINKNAQDLINKLSTAGLWEDGQEEGEGEEEDEGQEDNKVLIVDKLEYALDDIPFVEVVTQGELFKETIQKRKEQNEQLVKTRLGDQAAEILDPATMVLAAVTLPSLISQFADVAGYFLTNYSITGREFDVKTEGLVAAVAGRLSKKVTVFLPSLFAIGDSALLEAFKQLNREALELKTSRDQLSSQALKRVNEQIENFNREIRDLEAQGQKLDKTTQQAKIEEINQEVEKRKENLRAQQRMADELNAAIQASDAIATAFENFIKSITTSTDGQPPKFVRAILRDKIRTLAISHILWLGNLSSGGEAITKQSRWSSGNVSFMSGTAVAFVLAETDGKIVAADTLVGLGMLDHSFSSGTSDRVRYLEF